MDLLADLTAAQREAVTHVEGPLLILAGAGSGKTRVITRRVAYLLHQGIRPGNILAITFTNKAAGEMRQRIEALVPGCRVWISTFHSLGARLLRQYADRFDLDPHFTIYDQEDRNRLLKDALEAAGIDHVRFAPERIGSAISRAKNELLGPERYAEQASDFFTQTVARVYPVYQRKLRDAQALDFDDLLYWPALGLRHDAELRAELDARFRFVLIDEYQDTNRAQYALARALSVDQPNLCVVGDPDQSIYGWRGSDIRNILDFERDFPQAKVITLEQNYRSTKAILRAADHLIAHNRRRKPKRLMTENPAGLPVHVLTYETGVDEAQGVARRIAEAVASGRRRFRDFALFVRINALSRSLEAALVQHRIPYQIVRGLAYFERKENRDILAYVRLLLNPCDDLSFMRVVNEPPRGVGKASLEHLKRYAEARGLNLLAAAAEVDRIPNIKGKAAAGLRAFAQLIADLRSASDAPADEVIRQVLTRSGYRQMLRDSNDPEDEERLANIEELITAARQFTENDPSRTIADFLENITLASDIDSWDDRQDCVSIMTLHAAKGLEFPVVFILAVEQNLLPHERSQTDEEIEEERRLAFVGMTRAKEELYLSHARWREFRGRQLVVVPSMFLEELPEQEVRWVDESAGGGSGQRAFGAWRGGPPAAAAAWHDAGVTPTVAPPSSRARDFREGMIVEHDLYGRGRIMAVQGSGAGRRLKIRFASFGERTFIADKVKLKTHLAPD
ncbi:MAG: UvrD-helicase domain-containing protein [Gemmataceae bacterium]|nr:UvrD-helicase domain-containing protein [Gemmataceae bacterium]MDW8267047.1 UvrD-helicase domain-containing protein [Gemmataceae bacterium]